MQSNRHIIPLFALSCIAISIITWATELFGLVEVCRYCQVQRTGIGLIGIILLFNYKEIIWQYLAMIIGLFSLHVSATQIFNNIYKKWGFNEMFIYLATAAFFILCAQLYIILFMDKNKN